MPSPFAIVGKLTLSKSDFEVLERAATRNALDLGRTEVGSMIAQAMRLACPVPGGDWDKFLTVRLKPPKSIPTHQHKRHAMLYYPDACEVVIDGHHIIFSADTIAYISPGVAHGVPPVPRDRLSVAMLVS